MYLFLEIPKTIYKYNNLVICTMRCFVQRLIKFFGKNIRKNLHLGIFDITFAWQIWECY